MQPLRFIAYLVPIALATIAGNYISRAAKSEVNFPKAQPSQGEILKAQVPEVQFSVVPTPSVKFPKDTFPLVKFPEITFPQIRVQENDQLTIITLPADLVFDFNNDTIRPDAEKALRQVSQAIKNRYPDTWLQILGHTDSMGSNSHNLKLSERQVAVVQKWLSEKGGINLYLMTKEGYGETQPIAPNSTNCSGNLTERHKNSRIEIVIQKLSNQV